MIILAKHMPLVLLLLAMANPSQAESQLYRWTDENGQTHYSDSLPPERAPDERREFTRSGAVKRDVERAPTESEILALEKARLAAERAQARQKEQRRLQAEYDRMLTHTYVSVSQMERSRDERLENVRALKNASLARQARYKRDILQLQEQAAQAERNSDGNPEVIYSRLENTRSRLENEQSFMREKDTEIANIQHEFAAYILRFKELRGND